MEQECRSRIEILRSTMSAQGLDGVLIMDRVSLYYYFNTIPGGFGYIPRQGGPQLFVRRGLARAKYESPFAATSLASFRELPRLFEQNGWQSHRKIGLELDRIPVSLFRSLEKALIGTEFVDISGILRQFRAVKSDREQQVLRDAGSRAAEAYSHIPALLEDERLRELDVMAEFEAVMRKLGHQGYIRMHAFNGEIYYGAFASGDSANATIAFDGPVGTPGLSPASPFLCSERYIGRREPIMVDVVFGYHGYMVDQTRVFSKGPLPQPLPEAHALARHIQDTIVMDLKPGTIGEDIYDLALGMARDAGFSDNFMGFGDNRVSFLGHGIGLELDELPIIAPRFKEPLRAGMVVAIEPKFFFDLLGAVGIENTYIVTEDGGEKLTPFPDDLFVIPE